MRYVAIILMVLIGGAFERGYIDWLGMGAMLTLAVPTAIAFKKGA